MDFCFAAKAAAGLIAASELPKPVPVINLIATRMDRTTGRGWPSVIAAVVARSAKNSVISMTAVGGGKYRCATLQTFK